MVRNDNPPSPPGTWTAPRARAASRGQTIAGGVAIALLALAGVWTLHPFLPALGWGVIFAVSLWPWFTRCTRRWPDRRRLALPFGFTMLILLVFVLPLVMVAATAIHDSKDVLRLLAEARAQGVPAPPALQRLPFGAHLVGWWQSTLGVPGGLNHLSHTVPGSGSRFNTGKRLVGNLLHRLLLIGFMLLILFFLLRDGENVASAFRIGSRRAFGPAGESVADQAVQAIRGTVNGLVIVGFGEGLILGVTYALAGTGHAAVLGLLTGLLSAIPFGAMIAVAIAAGMLAVNGHLAGAAIVALIGAIVIFLADHFVRPAFIGGATRLPFAWVLLGIFGGVETWGLIGLVLGPALVAVLMLLWREWVGAVSGALDPAPGDAAAGEPAEAT